MCLFLPLTRQQPPPPKLKLQDQLLLNKSRKMETLRELLVVFPKRWRSRILPDIPENVPNYIASILHRIKTFEIESSMSNMDENLRKSFPRVFAPITSSYISKTRSFRICGRKKKAKKNLTPSLTREKSHMVFPRSRRSRRSSSLL